jgi:hypothetical protein
VAVKVKKHMDFRLIRDEMEKKHKSNRRVNLRIKRGFLM